MEHDAADRNRSAGASLRNPTRTYDSRVSCTTGCHEWPQARQWHNVTVLCPLSTCSTVMWCSVPQLGHRCATHASLALRGENERGDSLVDMYFQLQIVGLISTSVTEFGGPVMFDRSCSSRSGGGRGLCRPMAV